MSATVVRADRVLGAEGVEGPGWVRVEAGRITEVGAGVPPAVDVDLGPLTLVPGFIDLHCHGGGGHSFSEGPDAARHALRVHREHGTTSSMASLVTDTLGAIGHQVRELAPLVADDELMGVHLEGPWLSVSHCGAHDPALLRDPVPGEVERLVGAVPGAVRMVTVATERAGGLDAVRLLADHGVIAALGHSDATYAQAQAAVDAGVRVATHLFNAARPLRHREPGLILALLERSEVVVELIADGVHLHPAVLRDAATRATGRFALVSDAMAAAGAADGRYRLGGLDVEVVDSVARLVPGGAIAGSVITVAQALRHAVHVAGLDLCDALAAVTTTPARVLGRNDIGCIQVGARADLVALDASTRVARVMRRGAWIDRETHD